MLGVHALNTCGAYDITVHACGALRLVGACTHGFTTMLGCHCGPGTTQVMLGVSLRASNALASDALYRYRNALLRNCNALFYFKMTLFYVFDDAFFA